MNDEELFLKELQEAFIEEAIDLIEQCEQYCLQLETKKDIKSCIDFLFRKFHTIKGTSATVGMQDLSNYTHTIESLLVSLKNEQLEVNSEIVNLLLEVTDKSKNYVQKKKEGCEYFLDVENIGNRVNNLIQQVEKKNNEETTDNSLSINHRIDKKNKISHEIKNLGDILLEEKKITEDQLESALLEQERKIGTILVERGDLDELDLQEALDKQANQRDKKGVFTPDEYIKLPLSKIDELIDYLGEQIILQTALNFCNEREYSDSELISKTIVQLNKITQDLQQSAISLRMLNLKNLFRKARRLVRDTSMQLGKEVNFVIIGENTELDKTIVDELSGPITHLIRNAVDHGIEEKKERLKQGKNSLGMIEIQAYQKSGFFYLTITDDGKGLDTNLIKEKALKLGIIEHFDNMNEDDLYRLIFHSGFSTREKATDISGRGIGMDVVKDTIEQLRGTIQIKSKKNEGCSFIIKLPLTLAIFNGMVVDIGEKIIIVPNSEILSIIDKNNDYLYSVDKESDLLKDNNIVYPIVDLPQVIGIKSKNHKNNAKHCLYLITTNGHKKYAIRIKDILGQQKVVLKNLPNNLSNLRGISGATILGDGTVSLVLDVNKTLSIYNSII